MIIGIGGAESAPISITTDTSNDWPDYEYYRCIGTALSTNMQKNPSTTHTYLQFGGGSKVMSASSF